MFQNLRRGLEFLELPANAGLLTDAEIESWASEIANNPMGIELQKLVISEMENLIEELEQSGFQVGKVSAQAALEAYGVTVEGD